MAARRNGQRGGQCSRIPLAIACLNHWEVRPQRLGSKASCGRYQVWSWPVSWRWSAVQVGVGTAQARPWDAFFASRPRVQLGSLRRRSGLPAGAERSSRRRCRCRPLAAVAGALATVEPHPWFEPVSWKPRSFVAHGFATKEETDHIIKIAQPNVSSGRQLLLVPMTARRGRKAGLHLAAAAL